MSVPLTPGPGPIAWQPRSYPQLLRGPRYRWWRGLLAILMIVGIFVAVQLVAGIGIIAYLAATGVQLETMADPNELTAYIMSNPWMFMVNNLVLAAMIPASALTVWACFGWRPRWVSSVRPGVRWGLLLLSVAITLVGFALYAGLGIALDGTPDLSGGEHVALLLVIILVTTPLQAAGEEYLFRGVLTQAIGSWFSRPVVSVLVSGLSTALLFAILHSVSGPQNLWLFVSRFGIGLINSYLTWATGGLEAAIGLHTVNNWVGMVPAVLAGDLAEQLANPPQAALSSLMQVGVVVLIAAGIVLAARRLKVERRHDPGLQSVPAGPPPGWPPAGPPMAPPPVGPPFVVNPPNRFGGQDFVR